MDSRHTRFRGLQGEKGLLTAVLATAIHDAENPKATIQERLSACRWLTGGPALLDYKTTLEYLELPYDIYKTMTINGRIKLLERKLSPPVYDFLHLPVTEWTDDQLTLFIGDKETPNYIKKMSDAELERVVNQWP